MSTASRITIRDDRTRRRRPRRSDVTSTGYGSSGDSRETWRKRRPKYHYPDIDTEVPTSDLGGAERTDVSAVDTSIKGSYKRKSKSKADTKATSKAARTAQTDASRFRDSVIDLNTAFTTGAGTADQLMGLKKAAEDTISAYDRFQKKYNRFDPYSSIQATPGAEWQSAFSTAKKAFSDLTKLGTKDSAWSEADPSKIHNAMASLKTMTSHDVYEKGWDGATKSNTKLNSEKSVTWDVPEGGGTKPRPAKKKKSMRSSTRGGSSTSAKTSKNSSTGTS